MGNNWVTDHVNKILLLLEWLIKRSQSSHHEHKTPASIIDGLSDWSEFVLSMLCWSTINKSPPVTVMHYIVASLTFPAGLQRFSNKHKHFQALQAHLNTKLLHGLSPPTHPPSAPSPLMGVDCGRPSCSLMAHWGPFKIIKKDDKKLQAGLQHYGWMFVLFD